MRLLPRTCAVIATATSLLWGSLAGLSAALPLSAGDRIRLYVSEPDLEQPVDETFRLSGLYEINLNGNLELPLLSPLPVAGQELESVEQQVRAELIRAGLFQPSFVQVSAEIVEWAPVPVLISGAVFIPGEVFTDGRPAADLPRLANQPGLEREEIPFTHPGDYPTERSVTPPLRQSGGGQTNSDFGHVRPISNHI